MNNIDRWRRQQSLVSQAKVDVREERARAQLPTRLTIGDRIMLGLALSTVMVLGGCCICLWVLYGAAYPLLPILPLAIGPVGLFAALAVAPARPQSTQTDWRVVSDYQRLNAPQTTLEPPLEDSRWRIVEVME